MTANVRRTFAPIRDVCKLAKRSAKTGCAEEISYQNACGTRRNVDERDAKKFGGR